jgi:hypothetical protein
MGKWKAVQQPISKPIQLYNLDDDLGEQKDVAAQHADLVARAKKRMEQAYTPSARWMFPDPKPMKSDQ